jgi:hypothetical protein
MVAPTFWEPNPIKEKGQAIVKPGPNACGDFKPRDLEDAEDGDRLNAARRVRRTGTTGRSKSRRSPVLGVVGQMHGVRNLIL